MSHIALISTPWPLFNRPSIQLGTLKAFVREKVPGVDVEAFYAYLTVAEGLGYGPYGRISESTWLGEALYAGLLYPEKQPQLARFWRRKTAADRSGDLPGFEPLSSRLGRLTQQILDRVEWGAYLLAGFSICYGQLTSTLYFIRKIKEKAPGLKVVVGGPACAGELGQSLLNVFPDIDFVVQGEGELPLTGLIEALKKRKAPVAVSGLLSRVSSVEATPFAQVPHLDALPPPDYADYFSLLKGLAPEKRFQPRIPMEISRGCWWRKSSGTGGPSGCAFCNLNLQWKGYRAKSHGRILRELDTLTDRYQALSVSFMDNLLPARGLARLFGEMKNLQKDFRLFSEIRAKTPPDVLAAMGTAGMRQVQVGVEALSSLLLRKINKGTTAMDNVEIMKNCEIPGFPDLAGNLILEFPSSDEKDVEETLANLDFVLPFRPLKAIPFWLGYGSPVWRRPAAFGINRVSHHAHYTRLFPKEVLKKLRVMIQGYQGPVRYQHRLWQPVRDKIDAWHRFYSACHKTPGSDPILTFQDGREFMIIRQRRPGRYDMTHKLRGSSRRIYLFCHTQRPLTRILEGFPGFGEDQIRPFLRMMVDKRLMFREGDRFLSLAIPVKRA